MLFGALVRRADCHVKTIENFKAGDRVVTRKIAGLGTYVLYRVQRQWTTHARVQGLGGAASTVGRVASMMHGEHATFVFVNCRLRSRCEHTLLVFRGDASSFACAEFIQPCEFIVEGHTII